MARSWNELDAYMNEKGNRCQRKYGKWQDHGMSWMHTRVRKAIDVRESMLEFHLSYNYSSICIRIGD